MPRRPAARSRARGKSPGEPRRTTPAGLIRRPGWGRRWWIAAGLGGLAVAFVAIVAGGWIPESPESLRARAESAARAGDWATALRFWRSLNATSAATGASHLAEARACLSLGRAAQAEQSLRRAIAVEPSDPEPWKLLLEILWVEDRTLDAQRLGWEAYVQVRPEGRRL